MSANGRRRPPRPEIEVVGASATPDEAAAIAAALEQFLAETAPPPESAAGAGRWQCAALREGVERDPGTISWGPCR
jgi:hypothetical protein